MGCATLKSRFPQSRPRRRISHALVPTDECLGGSLGLGSPWPPSKFYDLSGNATDKANGGPGIRPFPELHFWASFHRERIEIHLRHSSHSEEGGGLGSLALPEFGQEGALVDGADW